MTPTTRREKMLMLVLPAAVILGLYGFKLAGLRQRSTAAAAGLVAAQKARPTPAQLTAEHRRLAETSAQAAEIERKSAEWKVRWQKLQRSRGADSPLRIEAIEGITALLNHNRLQLIEGQPAETGDGARLPAALDRVATQLAEKNQRPKVQLWRLEFVGSYEDVVRALDEINDTQPLAIPVHLQMQEARLTTRLRHWTLFLWI
jgi:hypothetical protein